VEVAKRPQHDKASAAGSTGKRRRGRPPARESAAMREEFGNARVIKRYGNRRLYDASLSRCVTLDEIAQFVRAGEDVRVIDSDSGEDITRRILTQIILEAPNQARLDLLPVEFLRKLISLRDEGLTSWMEQYLQAGAQWLDRQGAAPGAKAMQDSIDALFPWFKRPPERPPAAPRTAEETTVRDEIDELQQRLAELAARMKRR
jgi:polyhydroxyalkanoate synthesis repressor PhaR